MASKRVGKIYKIKVNKDFYIGSTWDFDYRLKCHTSKSKNKNYKLYKAIRDNNNKFEMILLYNYECYTDTELRIEERRCYDELKPNLNVYRPYTTQEERIEQKKQYKKQYNNENRETIREQVKQYRIENRETLLEKQKQNYIKNKESRLEYQKQHYIENRENNLENKKKHRDNNKYICGCGSRVLNENAAIRNHAQTQRHKKYLL